MKDIRLKLTCMWLHAMDPRTALPGGARAHIEHVLGNEYRHTSPCRDCGESTHKDRHDEYKAA